MLSVFVNTIPTEKRKVISLKNRKIYKTNVETVKYKKGENDCSSKPTLAFSSALSWKTGSHLVRDGIEVSYSTTQQWRSLSANSETWVWNHLQFCQVLYSFKSYFNRIHWKPVEFLVLFLYYYIICCNMQRLKDVAGEAYYPLLEDE